MIALAAMLVAAAIAGWLAVAQASWDTRSYVRFACMLYAALAVASTMGQEIALSVTLIVSASAPAFLTFAARFAFRGPVATPLIVAVLLVVCAAGMTSAATGMALLAFAPFLLCVNAMIAISLRGFSDRPAQAVQMIAAACALLAGAAAFAAGGVRAEPALLLFSAAGLLGISLALAPRSNAVVDEESTADLRAVAIRQPR